MRQQAEAKDLQVCDGDAKIPDKVTGSKGLDQATSTGVTPDAGLPVHGGTLLIGKGDIEGDNTDKGALKYGDDMRVPASPFALVGRVISGSVLVG